MGYNTTVREVRQPTPEEMAVALREAAHEGHWNHWRHEVARHAGDWVAFGEIQQPLTPEAFARLPEAVAAYPNVDLCTYLYRGRRVWGYQARYIPFAGYRLSVVIIVYDPLAGEIVHCMGRGPNYLQNYRRHKGSDFVEVRWRR